MKSIKEKAEECSLVREYVDSCGNLIRENSRVKQEQFTLGANYVLDEIENVIKSDRILGHPFPSLGMRYNQIVSVIEQLKK